MLIYISIVFLIILLIIINRPKNDNTIQNLFEKLSKKNKHTLQNIKKKCYYTNNTIPFKIRLETNYIINLILSRINSTYKTRYYFIEIDNIIVKEDNYGNKQYEIKFLANNNIDCSGIRFKLDVIVYVKKTFFE